MSSSTQGMWIEIEGDMMNNKILRCAIYIRVSTEEQHLEGLSLPAQRKTLTDYANARGYIIAGYYADEGVSARKSMKYRKGLLKLLEDVKQDKIDMILVTKLDRWFRNIKDYNITEEILQSHNCNWKTIYENYDSSTANGQMVINIMLSVNQAESDRTSERIKAVFDYKRSIGEVTSGMCAPYGYKVINNRMQKDSEVSDIVEDAYKYYFNCFSRRKVDAYIKDKYGDRAPSSYKIDFLFRNEKYAGKCREDLNYCEPYISLEQFRQIQTVTQTKLYPQNAHTYIFSGLIRCPVCERPMTGTCKKQKLKNGNVSVYPRYRCCQKYDRHKSPCITEGVVEQYMINHIFSALRRQYAQIKVENSAPEAKSNINKTRRELERLNNMYQKGRITEQFYDSEYERLQNEMQTQEEAKAEFIDKHYSKLVGIFSCNWLELYLRLDNSHKNAFWKFTIENIHIDPDTHKICGFQLLL